MSLMPFLILLLQSFLLISSATPTETETRIQTVCSATRYKSVCNSTISQAPELPPNPTTNEIINASIQMTLDKNAIALAKVETLLINSTNLNLTIAAKSCVDGLTYSDSRLKDAAKAFGGDEFDVADARAWATAAAHNNFGCWAGLKNVNFNSEVSETIIFMQQLSNMTSNTLSIITAFQRYGNDSTTWGPPQTERDNYWGPDISKNSVEGSTIWSGLISVPKGLVPNVTVCGSGCNRSTVQSAVDAAPDQGKDKYVIYIKEGVYNETVIVAFEKKNVVFLGDGMGKTVITGNLNVGIVGLSTYNSSTVGVIGDGFMAANLTISNASGPNAHQAVAFRSSSDQSIIEKVEFLGHQDTLYAHSLRQLYTSCTITGTVDFIFGNAAAFFQDCRVLVVPRLEDPDKGEVNTVTAHGRTDPAQATGFVFNNCVVNGTDEYFGYYGKNPKVHRNYLGRPWKEFARTVFVDCDIDGIVGREGWYPWNGDFALSTLFYGEFGNRGAGADVTGRVPWSSPIPQEHVGVYSVQNFIQLRDKSESASGFLHSNDSDIGSYMGDSSPSA